MATLTEKRYILEKSKINQQVGKFFVGRMRFRCRWDQFDIIIAR